MTTESMTAEECKAEYTRESNAAIKKHFSRLDFSIVPNATAFVLDMDVQIDILGATLHEGMFFLLNEDADKFAETNNPQDLVLYATEFERVEFENDEIDPSKLEYVPMNDGSGVEVATSVFKTYTSAEGTKVRLEAKARPLKVSTREEPLFLHEVATWAAIQDAEAAGEHDKAQRLFNVAYTPVQITTEGAPEDVIETRLATYKPNGIVTSHTLAMKAIEGLKSIAYGETEYELLPRGGKSKERYVITASEEHCSKFFIDNGGNAEQLKKIAATAYTLSIDDKASSFEQDGRVWFTTNAIAEQLSRTTGGAISGKNAASTVALVDAGLLALSGAQLVGTDPSGKPTNVMYVVNAERREKVTYNGQVYTEVWGFTPKDSVGNYSKLQGRNYRYPLLKSTKPLTVDETGYEYYLNELLNQLRGELYTTTKQGKPKPATKTRATVRRNYETLRADKIGIFQQFYPAKPPTSRQKRKLIEGLNKVLQELAAMEVHGERREGMPLSIEAYSERDPSRGRGGGAWDALVITASRNTHAPRIDLLNGKK